MNHASARPNLRVVSDAIVAPPAWVEYAYYAVTLYGIVNVAWGISIRLAGTGALALLTGVCLLEMAPAAAQLRRALAVPLLCALSFIAIQLLVHGEDVYSLTTFVTWIFALVIVQSLTQRPGFLHRFAVACFAIGLTLLPFIRTIQSGTVARVGLDSRLGFANPNDLSAWFGFCCLYFIVLSVETRRLSVRLVASVLAGLTVMIIALTVSRGPIISVAIATVIALRRTLRRGFLPALGFLLVLWVAFGVGLFDEAIRNYDARLTVESGRLTTWPLAFERIIDAPWFGVGISKVGTWVPVQGQEITPHNSFIFLLLAAGLLPFGFFVYQIVRLGWRAVSQQRHSPLLADHPFRLPLLIYLVLSCQSLDYPFMSQWGVVTLCMAAAMAPTRRTIRVRYVENARATRVRSEYA